MQTTIPATRAKNNFGELIRRVYTTGERVVVEKDGIPVVVVAPIYNPDSGNNPSKAADPLMSKVCTGKAKSGS